MDININETSKTLWIGDLDSWMDETFLTSLLGSLGYSKQLISIKIIKDKTSGQPLKYGFIQFVRNQSANNFYQNYNNRIIQGTQKQFKLNWASYGGTNKINNNNKIINQQTQVYVGDLDLGVTEQKLLQFFRTKYSSAFQAKIINDVSTKMSKGYGFVKFTNSQQAHKAIVEMNGQHLNGKAFKVSTAYLKSKEQGQEQYQQVEGLLALRQKLYSQYYSIMNDPLLKAQYEKQILKTFGNQQAKKLSIKQSLQTVGSLNYPQTKQSQELLSIAPRALQNKQRNRITFKIYQ